MRLPTFVLGYHGCERSIGEAIVSGQQLVRVSQNPHDWLGNGAYFWENNPKRAFDWACLIRDNPRHFQHRILQPFVIGAVLDLGNCLDLTDGESLDLVKSAFGAFERFIIANQAIMPRNEAANRADLDLVKRNLDCAVINFLHDIRKEAQSEPFDTVRGVFIEGAPLFERSKIMAKTHVQIAVRDPTKSVIGYFIPKPLTV